MVSLAEELRIITQTLDSEQQNTVSALFEKITQRNQAQEQTLAEKNQELSQKDQEITKLTRQLN